MHVREMTEDDVEAVAEVRVRAWQSAYRGLVPQPYLDAMSPAAETARRRRFFAAGRGVVRNLVAADGAGGGQVTGWAAAGPRRTQGDTPRPGPPGGDGELYALYVHPDHIGTGVGRLLMAAVLEDAAARGCPRMFLWVLEGNARARRFYERAGFAADGLTSAFEVGGAEVPEVRYLTVLGGSRGREAGPGRQDHG
ncbi:GNAT family N-acetyltransferase [Streptomyces sp. NPDC007083]|uniref:GNAT family N-acetyltransferase n=1 Tax=unclassified Streptomyces TaxID=2593676 RepID=UPI0033FE262A